MFNYEGKLVRLRPLQLTDKERSIVWRNDPRIRDRALSYRFPITDAMENTWYEKMLTGNDSTKVYFAIESKKDDIHIGFINLYNIDYISSTCYFSIVIGNKLYQKKGNALESMHIMFKFAFSFLNLRKINLEVVAFNHRAINLYRSFGFIEEGILRKQVYMCGNYYDKHCMGIFKKEYFDKYPSQSIRHHKTEEEEHTVNLKTEINKLS